MSVKLCFIDFIFCLSCLILFIVLFNWCLIDDIFCFILFNLCFVLFIKNLMLLVLFLVFVRCCEIFFEMGSGCNEEKVVDCGNWFLWVEIFFFIDISFIELFFSFCCKLVCLCIIVLMFDMVLVMVIFDCFIYWLEVLLFYVLFIESWFLICFFSWRIFVKSRFMCKIVFSLLCFLILDCFIFC